MKSTAQKKPAICSVDGCGRPRATRSWCANHYQRWWRYGDPTYAGPPRRGCSTTGCGEQHYARGWCYDHYQRWRKRTNPPPPVRCKLPECSKPRFARGWCTMHYMRWYKRKNPRDAGAPRGRKPSDEPGTCSIDGCSKARFARGWCRHHYDQDRHGRAVPSSVASGTLCKIDGCTRAAQTDEGWCYRHFWQWYESRPMTQASPSNDESALAPHAAPVDPIRRTPARQQSARTYPDWMHCSVEGCTNRRILGDLCHEHAVIPRSDASADSP